MWISNWKYEQLPSNNNSEQELSLEFIMQFWRDTFPQRIKKQPHSTFLNTWSYFYRETLKAQLCNRAHFSKYENCAFPFWIWKAVSNTSGIFSWNYKGWLICLFVVSFSLYFYALIYATHNMWRKWFLVFSPVKESIYWVKNCTWNRFPQ